VLTAVGATSGKYNSRRLSAAALLVVYMAYQTLGSTLLNCDLTALLGTRRTLSSRGLSLARLLSPLGSKLGDYLRGSHTTHILSLRVKVLFNVITIG
jgi:hypothetical protein